MRFLTLLLFILFAFSSNLPAQTVQSKTEDLPNPFTFTSKYINQNNYITPIFELKAREAEYLASPIWKTPYLEIMILLYGYVGDYDKAYDYEKLYIEATPSYQQVKAMFAEEMKDSPLAGYKMLDAAEAIVSVADERQVIMVNEEHRTPFHRILTYQLLAPLYAKGFRYFAVETLASGTTPGAPEDKKLSLRGYPVPHTGYYTADPVFAEVIRQALRLGYKLVPYESIDINCKPTDDNPEFCSDQRERGQAQQINERVLKSDPKAKILVHVGRGHNSKSGNEKFSFMAKYFKEFTKINPFTVDQVRYSERRDMSYEHPLYRLLTSNNALQKPSAFQAPDGGFYHHSEGYDLTVFHPRMRYENGRAAFLQMIGTRKAEKIDLKKLMLKSRNQTFAGPDPILIQAFYAHESADTIPADQIILYPNEKIPVLMLPKGEFRIRAVDKTGKVLTHYWRK